MKQKPAHNSRGTFRTMFLLTAAGALFIAGTAMHLKAFSYPGNPYIFGDTGDGLFNLWIMEHVSGNLLRGDWNILDGHIFWPENGNTLLWSDNLMVPSLLYTLLKLTGLSMITVFWLVNMAMSLLGFAAYGIFFFLICGFAMKRFPELPEKTVFFVPVLAYLACFSSSRIQYYTHFQNLSSLWLFTMVSGFAGYMASRKRAWLLTAAVSQILLVYSAPYYAVLGGCFWLAWIGFESVGDRRGFSEHIRNNLPVLVPAVLAALPAVYGYARAPKVELDQDTIHNAAMKIHHLFVPVRGTAHSAAELLAKNLPRIHHESPAYAGAGLLAAGALFAIAKLRAFGTWLLKTMKSPVFIVATVTAILCCVSEGALELPAAFIGLVLVFFLLLCVVRKITRTCADDPLRLAAGFTFFCAIITWGIASGPRGHFTDQPVNPSIWGLANVMMPGISHIRAPGRFAVVAQGLLAGAFFALFLAKAGTANKKKRPGIFVAAGLITIFQAVDQAGAHASTTRISTDFLSKSEEQIEFFSKLNGPALVFPTKPFHHNTRPMLYFNDFANITLINGYSARSSKLFDEILSLARKYGSPSNQEIELAESRGCQYLIVCKRRTSKRRIKVMRQSGLPLLFEDNHFMVLAPNPRISSSPQ